MSSLTEITNNGDAVDQAATSGADGRTLRRERNVAAARTATLEFLAAGVHPSLAEIAERAGVATRSVYRYFGDAESAIADAVEHRANRAREVFASEPTISASMPFDERLAMMILRRIRLERLTEPLQAIGGLARVVGDYVDALDAEVRAAFEPEISAHAGDDQFARLLCASFRIRAVRSMRDTFSDDDELIAGALSRAVSALVFHADSITAT